MKNEVDANLYYLVVGDEVFIIVLYVDDLLPISSLGLINDCKSNLVEEFGIKDLGFMHYFLGMEE